MPPLFAWPHDAPTRPFLPVQSPRQRYPIHVSESPSTLTSRALVGANTVPQGYGNAPIGPDSGTVAGIVLGSVAGFLLLLALLYWCLNIGQGPRVIEEVSVGGGTESVVSWHSRPRGPPRRHHRRSRHSPRHEKIEIRRERERARERVVPVRVEREDQIIVEEFRTRSRSRSRPRDRSVSRGPLPPRNVPSDDGDVIVVEEDHTPPRRRRDSTRSQRARRSEDRRSPYREDIYIRDVSRQRSRSRA